MYNNMPAFGFGENSSSPSKAVVRRPPVSVFLGLCFGERSSLSKTATEILQGMIGEKNKHEK
jgi:hypothetical protein